MASISSRRPFIKHAALLLAGAQARPWLNLAAAAQSDTVTAETSAGKVRGDVVGDVKSLQGHPLRGDDGRQEPLHAADETDAVDWYRSPSTMDPPPRKPRQTPAGISGIERGLPGAERVDAGP